MNISVKINTGRIDKSFLFQGKKGVYLDAALWKLDEPDEYGNDYRITQIIPQEERKAGKKGPIIGSAKIIRGKKSPSPKPDPFVNQNDSSDEIPF